MSATAIGQNEIKVSVRPFAIRLSTFARLAPPAVAAIVSSLAVMGALRLWHMHLGVPLQYSGDSLAAGMNVKQVVVNGWYFSDSHLAAPFVQHFQDWPLPDVISLSIAWVLGLFTNNWAAVTNGMFLLSFPLASLTGWWAFKKLGVSTWVAAALGVVFSLLPYHHVRGESHLFLSNYFVVPFGMYLAVKVLSGEELFTSTRRYRSRFLRFASARTLQTAVLAVLIGLDGIYYAAFTLLFIVTAFVARLLVTRRWRDVLPGVAVAALIFVAVIAATAPTLIYHLDHGSNPAAGIRQASDTEIYGLKLSQMLVPTDGHRISAFNSLQARYINTFPISSERGSAALGILGAVGLLWLIAYAVVRTVRRSSDSESVAAGRHAQLASLTVVALVVGTVGGLSTMISLLVTPEIRSWNRLSIFIGVFALCAVGLLVDRGIQWAKNKTLRVAVSALAAIALVAVGFFDQTNRTWVPDYAGTSQAFLADQTYFHSIQTAMPAGSDIYELPQQTFPEAAPINALGSYDLIKPYLHTSTLHWSFGGVKGRLESTWQQRLPAVTSDTADRFLSDIVAAGFTGVYIDGNAFADNGTQIRSDLDAQLGGTTPMVDETGKRVFYDIRSFAQKLQQTEASQLNAERSDLLFPVFVENVTKPYAIETQGNDSWNWANGSSTQFPFYDAAGHKEATRISFQLQSATDTQSTFQVTWPDGTKQSVQASDQPVTVTSDVQVPNLRTQLKISSNAPRLPTSVDPRNLHFRVLNLTAGPVG